MIWTKDNFSSEHLKKSEQVTTKVYQKPPIESQTPRVAIIGGGPKGFYALKALFQALKLKKQPLRSPLSIDWFNDDSSFACGKNFNTQQPDYLLINNCIGHIDVWKDDYSTEKLNFCDWINHYRKGKKNALPTDFASRALVGHYLSHALILLLKDMPDHLQLNFHIENVDRLYLDTQQQIYLGDKFKVAYKSVILCTGNSYTSKLPKSIAQDILKLGGVYIKHPYPIGNSLALPKQADVAVLGLGLTGIDVVLGLTEGRGGKFSRKDGGQYIPADKEVGTIYAWSRSNLPMLCRGAIYGDEPSKFTYLTEQRLASLLAIKGTIKAKSQLLPLLSKEITFAYYSCKWRKKSFTKKEMEAQIAKLKKPFALSDLLAPDKSTQFSTCSTRQDFIIAYLTFTIKEAKKGPLKSPYMAAASVWRDASLFFSSCYNFKGLTGNSQALFDQEWAGAFHRISYGPPISTMEKILILCKAGKLKFPFRHAPSLRIERQKLLLEEGALKVSVNHLIDARIGKVNLTESLPATLLRAGIASPLVNDRYQVGCMEIQPNGRLKSTLDAPIYLYGTPTEGNTLDNDTLAIDKYNYAAAWAADIIENHLQKK